MSKLALTIGTFLVVFIIGQFITAIVEKDGDSKPTISIVFALGCTLALWGLL